MDTAPAGSLPVSEELGRVLFEAMPEAILVVGPDVDIRAFNPAAAALVPPGSTEVLRRRGGEVLGCLRAHDVPAGCGRGPACRDCVIRSAVTQAYAGACTVRQRMRLELVRDAQVKELFVMVTAVPFRYREQALVMLLLEDISQVIALKRLIPICARCKKIRQDDDYWCRLEKYFMEHLDVEFSHGLCPECLHALYPNHAPPPADT